MTSETKPKCPTAETRRVPGPLAASVHSIKPLTPFSIEDILNKPCVNRTKSHQIATVEEVPPAGHSLSGRPLLDQNSPLWALEELASKTFKGLEVSVLQAAEGPGGLALFGQRNPAKKRRKSRTAFTNQQIFELEKRFLYQKYLSPADRDQIAQQLGLTNAQVITWFQNRRAKLKRDLEEMKADVESARAAGTVALEKLSKLAELEKCASGGSERFTPTRSKQDEVSSSTGRETESSLDSNRQLGLGRCGTGSEEDEDIQVDD
ncbi:transcription factor LBX1a [Nothobranchius furzeri]|uniref:Ladybird homeobox 1 n=1 Tax=Nothobranchius furzeri TaxID=105023 RepID=A0A8C6NIF5_NOTFU|nr:ladybird homeobox 1 [Nothobranchius furzeri]